MTTSTTFRTTDYDTAAGVYERINEIPDVEINNGSGIATFLFSDSDAPEAAKQFRGD